MKCSFQISQHNWTSEVVTSGRRGNREMKRKSVAEEKGGAWIEVYTLLLEMQDFSKSIPMNQESTCDT